ncbi:MULTISPECIES: type II toxin-antitoxin system RelE/ParE family toxin [Planktothrix]|uniref:Addiction module killer protein n=2 Tax=Planktothrix TaxID=54304 RepID=A0A6J7ZSN8_PLARU|nr:MULTISPECIES: type II toxin-antitoxin system RelE/ParE family toxin [Planktothrix]AQY61003.1 hypothetical protein [Planktothrix agardhii No758]CAH2573969.1 putative protein HI_1419 [Planktothrix rubescens]CAC5344996.1 conserved hypothetical protein [Planktothrix rubescens NIVA-CYA 18]CAD5965892.1 putative protein HI_1419 [Planktothrix rubescens NIVA-CYA 18]CAD5972634.1 putative protein HI_1419 [Planktothrix agardhii]
MEVQPRQVQNYLATNGKSPFEDWLNSLRDSKGKAIIKSRLKRVVQGNLGDYRSVGEGVYELRIQFGSGYRIYFCQFGVTIILLLCGGDKSTQEEDIRTAKTYWEDYRRRFNAISN